jgi:endonuclease/exonuclease/phosphatase (EEP) superfamily protein YafD
MILSFMLVWIEENISYFKTKGEVIVVGDMNARTRSLRHDAQQSLMPHTQG